MTTRRFSLVLPLAIGALALGSVPTASAGPPLPRPMEIARAMSGAGPWQSARAEVSAVGARPSACRSDLQMGDPTSVRARHYWGNERVTGPAVTSSVQVAVFTYRGTAGARKGVRRAATYPTRCPRTTEWVCRDCDGISTTWRTSVPSSAVGSPRTTWRYRSQGNLKSRGYVVVARTGRTVVRVTVERTRDFTDTGTNRFPRFMSMDTVQRVVDVALARAH